MYSVISFNSSFSKLLYYDSHLRLNVFYIHIYIYIYIYIYICFNCTIVCYCLILSYLNDDSQYLYLIYATVEMQSFLKSTSVSLICLNGS